MHYSAKSYQLRQEVLQLILASPDSQTMLSHFALKMGEVFERDACVVVAGIPLTEQVQMGVWSVDSSLETKVSEILPCLNFTQLKESTQNAEPWVIKSVSDFQFPPAWEFLSQVFAFQSLILLPTQAQGIINGFVILGQFEPSDWQPSDLEFLYEMAQPIAIACSQVQLQSQTQTFTRYQTLFKEITKVITQNPDIEPMLNQVLARTVSTLEVERGLIFLLKYKDPLFKNRNREEFPEAKVQLQDQWSVDSSLTFDESVFQLADAPLLQKAWQQSPQPLASGNLSELCQITSVVENPACFQLETLPTVLIIPLMGHQSDETSIILGFFVLQQRHNRCWTTEELELVNWLSIQVSTAILQNQALRRVQSLVEDRTSQLKWSLDVQAKLSEKMRQQIEELEHLNQLKDQFLATVSDELKHPLTKIKMAINMLKIAPEGEKRQRCLNILELECDKEINLVNDLLTLQKLESRQLSANPQKLDLKLILEELAQAFQEKWEDKGLTLSLNYEKKKNLTLYTDLDNLQRILIELLTNAGKFSDPDTTVSLTVNPQIDQEHKYMTITLTNIGRHGISPEAQAYIFDKFRRLKGDSDGTGKGTGLGLALVKALVQHLNGEITVSSDLMENSDSYQTSFTVSLPQFQAKLK